MISVTAHMTKVTKKSQVTSLDFSILLTDLLLSCHAVSRPTKVHLPSCFQIIETSIFEVRNFF